MGDASGELPPGKFQRAPRVNTYEHCIIARQNGHTVTGILVNLPDEGFCVESATPLHAEEEIEVRVLGARFRGLIKWAKSRRAAGVLHDGAA